MGLVDKFRNGGLPKLPPREEQSHKTAQREDQKTADDSASFLSGTTQCTLPAQASSSQDRSPNDERIRRSFLYLNLPTAAERAQMQKSIDERNVRKEEKE